MSTLNVTNISDGTNSTSTTNVVQGSAKAWGRYDGTTATINSSYNISSILDNGAGDFTLSFSEDMSSTDYTVVASAGTGDHATQPRCMSVITWGTTSVRLLCEKTTDGGNDDDENNAFCIFE